MKILKKIVALGLVGAMAATSLFACTKSPEEKVEEAFKSLGTSASATALADELGITAVIEKAQEKTSKSGIKLTLEDTDLSELAMLVSGSIDAFVAADVKDETKVLIGLGVGYAASELLSAELYIDEEQIAVALPGLIEKVPYVDFSGDLAKKLEKSVLMQQEGMEELDLDGIADMWKDKMANAKDDELAKFVLAFEEETEAIETFKDAIEINETDNKEFEINGKDKKCEGFEIVIPEEAVVELVEEVLDYYFSEDAREAYEKYIEEYAEGNMAYDVDDMKDELDTYFDEITDNAEDILAMVEEYISDIEAEMYVYEGSIVSLEAEIELSGEVMGSSEPFEVGIEFESTGGDYGMYDNYELSVKMMSMNMISITKETDNSDDEYEAVWTLGGMAMQEMKASAGITLDKKKGDFEFEAMAEYDGERFTCTADGTIEVEKKKTITVEFDSIKLEFDGELIFEVSGEYYMETGVDVDMPKGKKFDILTSKQSEWDDFVEELSGLEDKFMDIMEILY